MASLRQGMREVRSLYENGFKQLSSIQQRQVGLIVGAAVGDAAALAVNGLTVEVINRISCEETVAFAPSHRAMEGVRPNSFSYDMMYDVLQTMASSRGDFPVDYVTPRWMKTAALNPDGLGEQHGSLLHVLSTLLPLPAIYPWADDDVLREYIAPFVQFQTESPILSLESSATALPCATGDEASISIHSAVKGAQMLVREFTASAMGVVLRFLQSNPDAVRNACFMAVPGTELIFPRDVCHLCPPCDGTALVADGRPREFYVKSLQALHACGAAGVQDLGITPQRSVFADALVVRQSFEIAREAKSFEVGMERSMRLGGPSCQRSMLAGALLGSKFGIRGIPLEWVCAMDDYSPVCTMALEVAQWAWNPPHR